MLTAFAQSFYTTPPLFSIIVAIPALLSMERCLWRGDMLKLSRQLHHNRGASLRPASIGSFPGIMDLGHSSVYRSTGINTGRLVPNHDFMSE